MKFDRSNSYVPTNHCYLICVVGTWESHGHGPPQFEKQPKCACLVAFVDFMTKHPIQYYL
jgi:hypothetical protein